MSRQNVSSPYMMPLTNRITAHAIGDFSPPEFRAIAELLRSRCDVVFDRSPGGACERVFHARRWPEIVVVAQSRPGEIDPRELSKLQRVAPLARFIGLLGPWCEGEARSGSPWPGMLRTYWHQWTARWAGELLAGDRQRLWSLPVSTAPEDRLLGHTRGRLFRRPGLIAVASEVYETADMLCDACESLGYSACWLGRDVSRVVRGISLLLWDGLADELSKFRSTKAHFPDRPILAVLDFPRHGPAEEFLAAGAAGILSKPFLVDELHWHLSRVLDPPNESAHLAVA